MGLDMYLYAERQLSDETAEAVFTALGTTKAALAADEYAYLSLWRYNDAAKAEAAKYLPVIEAGGLADLVADDSPHGELEVTADGRVLMRTCAIYWRKANAVHSWFVENCQGGRDECQLSDPIPAEQLAHLRSMCSDALTAYETGDFAKAGEIMTPQSGFFFGSTEVDEWWAADLRHTVEQIEAVVRKAIEIGGVTFRYQSSW